MKEFDAVIFTDTPTYPQWTRGYGAHRIASHLRQRGYDVLVIDFLVAIDWELWNQLCELTIGPKTKFVGFSTTWWPYRRSEENQKRINLKVNLRDLMRGDDYIPEEETIPDTFTKATSIGEAKPWVDIIKKLNPKCKILLGGAKIDWYPDFPADHFMSGYAETQILDFLEQPRRLWPKLINHDTSAKSREWGWTSSFTSYTDYDQIKSDEILTLETARGCKFKCLYCAFPLVGQKVLAAYIKNKETLYKELLENYEKWGATSYWIADDTLNDSTDKLRYIAEVVKQLPFKPRFRAYLRLDVLAQNPEQIQLLLDMGLSSCFFGIESFHPETAKIIGKGMSEEKRKAALYECQRVWGDQVSVNAGYIIGLPKEDYSFAKKQMEWFVQEDCPVHIVYVFGLMIHPTGIYPNHPTSELDRNYEKYGYDIPDLSKHEYWFKDDGTDIKSFEQTFDIVREFNGMFEKKKVPVIEQIQYGMGNSIRDPLIEYFPNLINMLKQR